MRHRLIQWYLDSTVIGCRVTWINWPHQAWKLMLRRVVSQRWERNPIEQETASITVNVGNHNSAFWSLGRHPNSFTFEKPLTLVFDAIEQHRWIPIGDNRLTQKMVSDYCWNTMHAVLTGLRQYTLVPNWKRSLNCQQSPKVKLSNGKFRKHN